MELIGLLRARARRAYWRARYVYFDTPRGLQLRIGGAICMLIGTVWLGAAGMLQLTNPPPQHAQHAVVLAIIALVVAIVAAILAYVMAPKPKAQKPRGADAPTTEDGQSVLDVFGTVWIDDSFVLAWKGVGTVPIKGKSK